MDKKFYSDIIEKLNSGKVIAYPTETIWGLGCDGMNAQAVSEVFDIKGREHTKAVSLLVRDHYTAGELAEISAKCMQLIQLVWPGPLTLVLPAKSTVLPEIHGGTGFVGLRCSDHPFVRGLFENYNSPLVTTSANRSGESPASTMEEARAMNLGVEVVGWEEKAPGLGKASTVIKVTAQDQVSVLRWGAMDQSQLKYLVDTVHLKLEE